MPSSSDEESDTLFQSHYNAANNPPSSSGSSSSSPTTSPTLPSLHHSTTHSLNHFAPPFYNRPLTPLPPSPSLTSLLRPSRPTTPSSSDNDLDPTKARSPLPRASPRVPTYEYYGFVLYLVSSLVFLMYILWSYLPSPFLHAMGIYYYPNRWLSLAIPSWLVMALAYVYVALAGYNTGHLTLGLGDLGTVVDEAASIAVGRDGGGRLKGTHSGLKAGALPVGDKGFGGRKGRRKAEEGRLPSDKSEWKALWSVGTDAVMDVPLGGVCEVLYGERREKEQGEYDEHGELGEQGKLNEQDELNEEGR